MFLLNLLLGFLSSSIINHHSLMLKLFHITLLLSSLCCLFAALEFVYYTKFNCKSLDLFRVLIKPPAHFGIGWKLEVLHWTLYTGRSLFLLSCFYHNLIIRVAIVAPALF